MRRVKEIIAFRFVRFLLVATINAAVNFSILNYTFYDLHESKLLASIMATSCVVILSFVLNRNFVFVDKERPARKLALFITVTVSGILVIQNVVYVAAVAFLSRHHVGLTNTADSLTGLRLSASVLEINLGGIVASLISAVWNYNGYRIYVFNGERRGNEILEKTTSLAID
ncbi:MAG TPA: GtrA family protein [Candidatus Saccharimonadales bacterium]|nr:GtrA family protein [Candidatus Saccharimonadales bacterium]